MRIGVAHGGIKEFLERVAGDGERVHNAIPADRASRARLDYLALGDWHGRLRIDERTWYSGTPEATHFSLLGAVLREFNARNVMRTAAGRKRFLDTAIPEAMKLALKQDTGKAPDDISKTPLTHEQTLKVLLAGKTATFIVFQSPEEGIGIPVDLNGFREGYEALP